MSNPGNPDTSYSLMASGLGSGGVGLIEVALTFPLEGISRRRAVDTKSIRGVSISATWANMLRSVWGSATTPLARVRVLYGGASVAVIYKFLQRGSEIPMKRMYEKLLKDMLDDYLLKAMALEQAALLTSGLAGALAGVTEAMCLHPIDTMKVRMQVDAQFREAGIIRSLFSNQSLSYGWLWNGVRATMLRNAFGSASFWTMQAYCEHHLPKNPATNCLTWQSKAIASVASATASIVVGYPIDIVKSRMQSNLFPGETGWQIARHIWEREGLSAFAKGLPARLPITVARRAISFFLGQEAIHHVSDRLDNKNTEHRCR